MRTLRYFMSEFTSFDVSLFCDSRPCERATLIDIEIFTKRRRGELSDAVRERAASKVEELIAVAPSFPPACQKRA